MTNLSYGSSGSDVKKLQTLLNNNGYKLDVDGQFGSKTQAAVRDYQSKNKLAVDGIVGTNTWGALNAASPAASAAKTTASASATKTAAKAATPAKTTPTLTGVSTQTQKNLNALTSGYTPSASVAAAQKAYTQQQAAKPAEYVSPYDTFIQDAYQKLMNRGDFSYDLNGDALYQQYKDMYMSQGKLAMQDTMGQAAGLTGGYGSSYAQAVGQQQYNAYLQQLNDKVPEFYDRAYQRYRDQGTDLYNQLNMSQQLDESAYGRYRDRVGDWQTERNALYDMYNNERSFDYGSYQDKLNSLMNIAEMEMSDYQFQQEFGLSKEQFEYEKAFQREQFEYQKQQDAAALAAQKKNSVSGSSSGSKSKSNDSGVYVAPKSEETKYSNGISGTGSKSFTQNEIADIAADFANEHATVKLGTQTFDELCAKLGINGGDAKRYLISILANTYNFKSARG